MNKTKQNGVDKQWDIFTNCLLNIATKSPKTSKQCAVHPIRKGIGHINVYVANLEIFAIILIDRMSYFFRLYYYNG